MKLFGSLSFRLALIYAGLFTVSVSLLGGLYFWAAIARPLGQVREQLAQEGEALSAVYRRGGADALAPLLERRAGDPSPRLAYHALLRPDGSVVTSNLPSWPRSFTTRWLRIEADVAREGDEDEYEALALDLPLEGEARLLIGRDIEDLDELEEGVRETLVWLLPALALLTLAGGALMSRAIGRRIDAMTATARRVIAGDLSGRIPRGRAGDDFDRLAETLNLMLDRIEASLEAVRRVSDSVAHELRTPLSRLKASLIELEAEPEAGAEPLRRAIEEADRLQSIFDSLLRISRIEASRHAAAFERVDLSELMLDAVDYYQPAAEAKGQRLTASVAPGLETRGDRDLLFQAVSNLLDNAIKYTPAGGLVAVSVGLVAGEILVAISDTGPGIAPEHREKVAERFFRAPSVEGVPGLGLGLSVVQAIAAYHRSHLRFESADPGLRVEWRLPRDDRPEERTD
ncbi:HAMP domain-containing sensor histidine kinase [Sphingosinicella sp. CPCC 101087]|uniref:sensor histidine kinase n=1 Tax=Sphingosinicella sp. CPCC 101087 TaxID=2497754 RepID=UPI00101C30B7|nr:ATP-binding protein [Sphingosinicella sp. CPCC 101087]